ncbi:MAG: excalibur calcium-binding domain-containing protein [Moraxellaceae bacterium]|nr:excalibur calcium-binding domain-containing protein [Moraxellaceae bacterium]
MLLRTGAAIVVLWVLSTPVLAHGGGTDASGCHTNRKTGEYHCHRPKVGGSPAQRSAPARGATSGGGVYFPNCASARAAGAAPLYRGRPGYRPALDRDSDGVACE